MKRALYFVLGGALLGIALTTWLAPRMIAWYFNPPVETGGFSCTAAIAWALRRLQSAQLWGIGVGGVLGLVVYGFVQRRRNKQQATLSSVPNGRVSEGGRNDQVPGA
jgi:hypothetical protein